MHLDEHAGHGGTVAQLDHVVVHDVPGYLISGLIRIVVGVIHVLPGHDDLIADREHVLVPLQVVATDQAGDLRHGTVDFLTAAFGDHGQVTILTLQLLFDQKTCFIQDNRFIGNSHFPFSSFQLSHRAFR